MLVDREILKLEPSATNRDGTSGVVIVPIVPNVGDDNDNVSDSISEYRCLAGRCSRCSMGPMFVAFPGSCMVEVAPLTRKLSSTGPEILLRNLADKYVCRDRRRRMRQKISSIRSNMKARRGKRIARRRLLVDKPLLEPPVGASGSEVVSVGAFDAADEDVLVDVEEVEARGVEEGVGVNARRLTLRVSVSVASELLDEAVTEIFKSPDADLGTFPVMLKPSSFSQSLSGLTDISTVTSSGSQKYGSKSMLASFPALISMSSNVDRKSAVATLTTASMANVS